MAILKYLVNPLNVNKQQKSGVTDDKNPKTEELIKIK